MAQQVDTEDLRIAEAQRQGEEKRQKEEQVFQSINRRKPNLVHVTTRK